MVEWIIARAKEGSTYRGLITIATAAGLTIKPELAEAIIAAGLAIAGLIGVIFSEKQA